MYFYRIKIVFIIIFNFFNAISSSAGTAGPSCVYPYLYETNVKWIIAFHGIFNLGAMFITSDPWLINARGFYFSPSSSMASRHQTARTWQWIMCRSPRAVPTKTVLDTWKYSVHMHYTLYMHTHTHTHTHARASCVEEVTIPMRLPNGPVASMWFWLYDVLPRARPRFLNSMCDAIRPAMSGKYYSFESKWL